MEYIKKTFNNNIEYENKIISKISFQNLLNIDINIPSIQRLYHKEKIDEIVRYQKEYFIKNKRFNFLGVLNLNYSLEDSKYFLIDGQHRYEAIKKLGNSGYDENVFVEVIVVNSIEGIKENYNIINQNTPLPDFSYEVSTEILNDCLKLFQDKYDFYDEIFSSSIKCRRPKVSRNRFEEALEFIVFKLKIQSPLDLFRKIENINLKLSKWNMENFPKINSLSNPKKVFNTCNEFGFYLGMFTYNSEEYIFDWVKMLIYDESGEAIGPKKKNRNRKKTIPKSVKENVWNKYIGESIGKSKCLCCKSNDIKQLSFEAGHVIPECKGGLCTVENLRPICKSCNGSMGSINMNDFMKQYYPTNLFN